ncbi:hypothetical protein Tco_1201472 [Tanacetum coccineum]
MNLLVFSLLSIAWIIAPAFALSRWIQKVCGKYSILIPLRRSFRAVRTSSRVPSLNLCFVNSHQSVLLVFILVDDSLDRIEESFHASLDTTLRVNIRGDIECYTFSTRDLSLFLVQEKQHISNVLTLSVKVPS